MNSPLFPLARGDFVLRKEDNQVGRVRSIWWDSYENEFCMNLSLFSHRGENVGRMSPACGGPRDFEPAIVFTPERYERIEEPSFPLSVPLKWIDDGKGNLIAQAVADVRTLPLRALKRREKKRLRKVAPKAVLSDYNPALEAASRRMAAQTLRDMIKSAPEIAETLRAKAVALEDEADTISPR